MWALFLCVFMFYLGVFLFNLVCLVGMLILKECNILARVGELPCWRESVCEADSTAIYINVFPHRIKAPVANQQSPGSLTQRRFRRCSSDHQQCHTELSDATCYNFQQCSKYSIHCHPLYRKYHIFLLHNAARCSPAWLVWNVTLFILKGLKRSTFYDHLTLSPPTGKGENSTKSQRGETLRRNTEALNQYLRHHYLTFLVPHIHGPFLMSAVLVDGVHHTPGVAPGGLPLYFGQYTLAVQLGET